MIRVAVAGAGDWGQNHVRALASLPGVRLDWVVDPDGARRDAAGKMAPKARVVSDLHEALADDRLDALVVASPGPTHGPIARAALAAGKHVLVEKPLAPTSEEAFDLVARARKAQRHLGVGHLLLFHPAVAGLKRLVDRGRLGTVRYIHCQRTNLGRVRPEEGALFSLAPHDISVMVRLLGRWPVGVAARGAVVVQPVEEDVVFVVLRFPDGVLGHIHLSWLDPLKVRCVSVVGDGSMAVFDDMRASERLRVVDSRGRRPGAARTESIVRVARREPLREELAAFARTIRTGVRFATPGEDGARVVRVLEAAQRSLGERGAEVPLRIR